MVLNRTDDDELPRDPDLGRPDVAGPHCADGPDAAGPETAGPDAAGPGVAGPMGTMPARRRGGGLGSRLRPGILVAIAAGGALGGAARYAVEQALPTGRDGFPWGTFAVNVSGSLALAVLLVFVLEVWPPTRYVRPFAAIGFLGAYTTFSTWMVETADLVAHGRPGLAAGYLAGSTLAGLAAVSLGLVLGRAVLTRRTRRTGDTPARRS